MITFIKSMNTTSMLIKVRLITSFRAMNPHQ